MTNLEVSALSSPTLERALDLLDPSLPRGDLFFQLSRVCLSLVALLLVRRDGRKKSTILLPNRSQFGAVDCSLGRFGSERLLKVGVTLLEMLKRLDCQKSRRIRSTRRME